MADFPTFPVLQQLFVKDAGGDAVRRQRGVMAEGSAAPEAEPLIKADRRRLVDAGLQPQHRLAGIARFLFEAGEERLADAPAPRRLLRAPSLDLGVGPEAGGRAAAHPRREQTRAEKGADGA